MIKLLFCLIGRKYLNDKGRRMLVLGSLYAILRKKKSVTTSMEELNEKMNIAIDCRGLQLAAILPEILWDKRKRERLESLPPERLVRYYSQLLPTWLKYDHQGNNFNFENDLQRVTDLASANRHFVS
ncbi:hypothetical protein 2050HW_00075 [Serratia phage vB_SmaM_ 2050HW]|nr:hypothetical protein HWB23_gp075 [Serratia phage vB_SmaM_ 2050HW]ATA65410.1 hypothetical protein 2050HW_00075 [Serratia phage vB_SmaM_ 2050HW]UCR74689.1 hypothetical protein [Serratia phage BUCT660]UQT03553.1 hypothetical protein KODAMA_00860 [Serratia phage vB_SmaM-Kodama]URG14256.1 hypothetical protein [Pectobacterium phage vB_ParM-25]